MVSANNLSNYRPENSLPKSTWIKGEDLNDVLQVVKTHAKRNEPNTHLAALKEFDSSAKWTLTNGSVEQVLTYEQAKSCLKSLFQTTDMGDQLAKTIVKLSGRYYDTPTLNNILNHAKKESSCIYPASKAESRQINVEMTQNQAKLTVTGHVQLTPSDETNASPVCYKFERTVQFDFGKLFWMPTCNVTELDPNIYKGVVVKA